MTVRELIANLLDYDMDAEVEVQIDTSNDVEFKSFKFENVMPTNEVQLTVELDNQVIIDMDKLEELEGLEE